ncbi:hypothetical protein [Marinospirillum sp.]|uniref:hypothetical protein n=1 Tax=Marinospirillum sp. TaxID=2183934 RepID=UPI00384BB2D7
MNRFWWVALFLVVYWPLAGVAATRYQQTTADATLAVTERPAVLVVPRLFLSSNQVPMEVTYIPHKGDARGLGVWSIPLSQSFADELLADHLHYYLPARYDHLLMDEQGLLLRTANDQVRWSGSLSPLPDGRVRNNEVLDVVTRHLDREVAPALQELLSDAAEVRYLEMNARERDTFITERARQLGMPSEVLESLLTAGYAFAFHLPEVSATLSITQRLIERERAPNYYVYSHRLRVEHPMIAEVLSFDGEHFESFASLESSPGALASGLAGSSLRKRVGSRNPLLQTWLEAAMSDHFVNHHVGINFQLKHYEDFRMQAPLMAGESGALELQVGNQESIRVNQPFGFHRQVDGQRRQLGWGQVTRVGDSCKALPESERSPSRLVRVSGSGEDQDLAIEHPWTGVVSYLRAGHQQNELDLGWGKTGAGELSVLDWGVAGNLGYLRNRAWLSEFWLRLGLGFGYAEGGEYQRFDQADFDDGLVGRIHFGFEKRWLLGAGWFVGAGTDMGAEFRSHQARGEGWNTELYDEVNLDGESFSMAAAYLSPELTLQKQWSPNTRLQMGVGYHYPLGTSAGWSDKDISELEGIDDFYFEGAQLEPGLSASLIFSWMLGSGGALAGMTSAPSTACARLAEY